MSFRPCFLGIVALTAVFFAGETLTPAQTTTNFTPWKNAQNAENVPAWAQLMLTRDFRNVTGTAREELLAKTLSALVEISSDSNVVPSTRYNAILAIGQLEASSENPRTAYPAALTYLIDVYQQADSPHYLKYGALLGIVRHAVIGINSEQQNKVIDLFLETVTAEFGAGLDEPPEPAVWDWFRQTALDGLTALKTVGTEGKVVQELLSLINDKSQELEELCNVDDLLTREVWRHTCRTIELASKAAKTLGDLDYSSATDIDAKKMTDTFIRLTKAACDVKHKMVSDFIEQEKTAPNPAILLERIVVMMKMCTHSVVWGMRSSFLTSSKPGENSFYASLNKDEPAMKRLDTLMEKIVELSAFFDEGDKTKSTLAVLNIPNTFKFDLYALRDALERCSEALTENYISTRQ